MGEPLPAAWVSPGLQPNTDLARERAACSFDVSALTHLLDGGAEVTATRHKLQRLVEQDPVFTNEGNHQMDRAQRYARGLEKSKRMVALAAQTGLSPQEQKLMVDAIADDMPTLLHQLMFIPNIEQLCDEEQKARWLPDAMVFYLRFPAVNSSSKPLLLILQSIGLAHDRLLRADGARARLQHQGAADHRHVHPRH